MATALWVRFCVRLFVQAIIMLTNYYLVTSNDWRKKKQTTGRVGEREVGGGGGEECERESVCMCRHVYVYLYDCFV